MLCQLERIKKDYASLLKSYKLGHMRLDALRDNLAILDSFLTYNIRRGDYCFAEALKLHDELSKLIFEIDTCEV